MNLFIVAGIPLQQPYNSIAETAQKMQVGTMLICKYQRQFE
jgi:hypothetical protein